MSYATLDQLRRLMTKTITIGDSTMANEDVLTDQGKPDTVSTETANQYLQFAAQYVNSRLRAVYFCPLKRIRVFETALTADADAKDVEISVNDPSRFNPGDMIRLGDDSSNGLYVVRAVNSGATNHSIVSLEGELASDFLVSRHAMAALIDYPDPVPSMCARIAASMIIDREFVAEQRRDVSTFGKTQRTLASNDMDDILNGTIRLEGQDHTGKRFVRTSLRDTPHATSVLITQRATQGNKEA
jgi:hypothetical protein